MTDELNGMRIAFLVANEGIEQAELERPWLAVVDAGGQAELVAPEPGEAQAMNHLDKADRFPVNRTTAEVSPGDYDGIMLPGGVANPDRLRTDEAAVRFVAEAAAAGTPIAVICHGPWTLVEADVVRGRTLTSWPSLQTDIRNAGGNWVDEEVVVCEEGPNVLVTSRKPDDLDAFCREMVRVLSGSAGSAGSGRAEQRRAG
jgi:protease I